MRFFSERQALFYFIIAIFLIVSFLFYHTSSHQFLTNWDDQENITQNNIVLKFNSSQFSNLFSPLTTNNEYQPLTVLYFAVIYKLFGLSSFAFHLGNIILHVLNVILLFLLAYLLFKSRIRAFFLAILTGVHPMTSEVVSWVSAANYLLFVFFMLSASILYVSYIKNKKISLLILSYIAFLLSLFAKSSAVIFPLLLLLFDYYFNRISMKVVFQKIPFFLLSGVFVIIAMLQKSNTLLEAPVVFSFIDKPFIASYIVLALSFLTIFPFNISLLYNYPDKSGVFLPFLFYMAFVVLIAIVLFVYKYRQKKDIIFGLLFFVSCILPVIHIVSYYHIGFYANRYLYPGAFGIFIACSFLIFPAKTNKKIALKFFQKTLLLVIPIILLLFIFLTYRMSKQFSSNTAFFKAVVKEKPDHVLGNYLLAQSLSFEGKYDASLTYYNKAINKNSMFFRAYYGRGLSYSFLGKYDDAIGDFTRVLENDSTNIEALFNRGLSHANTGMYIKALKDFNSYINIDSANYEAFSNRGGVWLNMNMLQPALNDFNKAIALNPAYAAVYFNRGLLYEKTGDWDSALADYSKAIDLKPDYFQAYNSRGVLKGRVFNELDQALEDVEKALSINDKMLDAYSNRAFILFLKGDTLGACKEWEYLMTNKYPGSEMMLNKYCN